MQNNLPVPKIKKIAIEDLDDIKIIRQLENMEMFDEIIKEKILLPLVEIVFASQLTESEVSSNNFLCLRTPYDIQHVTGQMVEREGRILECKLNVENCFVRCVV